MNRKSALPIPEAVLQLQRQLEQFRSTRPKRTKLPEPLWQAAVELARQHGVYPVAHPLRLHYMQLKKRVGGPATRLKKAPKPAFVELVASRSAAVEDCVIEFESARGGKMRIQWKASTPPDWVTLLRAWRDAER